MHFFVKAHRVLDFRGDLDDFVRLFVKDDCVYCPYFDNVAGYWKRRSEPNVFFTTYEKLQTVRHLPCLVTVSGLFLVLQDPVAEVRKVANFLQRPISQEEATVIARYTTFDSMKDNDFVNYSHTHRNGIIDFNIAPFFRSGTDCTNRASLEAEGAP